ncbi:MAG: hypothetical protein Q9174_000539 [Haloplaca sp. 1 TL-2023]
MYIQGLWAVVFTSCVLSSATNLQDYVGRIQDDNSAADQKSFGQGQGGWGGPKGPGSPAYPPPEGKEPDIVHVTQTSKESAHLYRLNGDYNPLHATPEPGERMGFGGAIMHGLFSWNIACHALLQSLGNSDPANLRDFEARFTAPVKAGDRLVTEAWRTGDTTDGWEEIRFLTNVEGGKTALSNGRALMKCGVLRSRL